MQFHYPFIIRAKEKYSFFKNDWPYGIEGELFESSFDGILSHNGERITVNEFINYEQSFDFEIKIYKDKNTSYLASSGVQVIMK